MPFDVRMPDGTIIRNVPDGTPKAEIQRKFDLLQQQGPDSVPEDVAKSFGTGVARGAIGIAGAGGDIREASLAGAKFLAERLGVPEETAESALGLARGAFRAIPVLSGPTSEEVQGAVEGVTGEFREPQTTAGEFAQTVGEFAPGALLPGGVVQRASQSVIPAVASEAAGQLFEGTPFETPARVAAGLAGGLSPAGVARLRTPLPSSRAVRTATQNLREEGVTSITAGQATGRKGTRAVESELGGSAAANVEEEGKRQFTAAVLKRAGVNKSDALKIESGNDLAEVVDGTFTRLGRDFDRLTADNTMRLNARDTATVRDALQDYLGSLPPNFRIPRVTEIAEEITQTAAQPISGKKYQSWRSALGKAVNNARTQNPEAAIALRQFQAALDNAMERSIRAVNPEDAGRFANVRRQYRNLVMIEDASVRAGQDAASGVINPKQLRAAVRNIGGKRSFARGKEDLGRLARDGELVLTDLPQSGTAPRLRGQNLGLNAAGPAGVGFGIGAMAGGPVGAGLGAAAGAVLPTAVGRFAVSRPGRAFLSNQRTSNFQQSLRPARAGLIGGGLAPQNR